MKPLSVKELNRLLAQSSSTRLPVAVKASRFHTPGKMNKTETSYSQYLESERLQGRILRWDYEPEKLRLAPRTYYTPDFRVIRPDGTIEFHESKGFWEDDARVKIKLAAALHPYKFFAAQRKKKAEGGGWTIKPIVAQTGP